MKQLVLIIFSIFSLTVSAKDLISKRNEFLWKLDTAQLSTRRHFVFASTNQGIIKEREFISYLNSLKLAMYDELHFYASSYKDEADTYSIALDFTGKEFCLLTINSNKDYVDVVNFPIELSYCENLLGFEYKHYMTDTLLFVLQRVMVESMFFNVANKG